MIVMKRFKIRSYDMGLYFLDREFQGLLAAGTHWMFDPLHKVRVEIVSQRDPWLVHDKLDAPAVSVNRVNSSRCSCAMPSGRAFRGAPTSTARSTAARLSISWVGMWPPMNPERRR